MFVEKNPDGILSIGADFRDSQKSQNRESGLNTGLALSAKCEKMRILLPRLIIRSIIQVQQRRGFPLIIFGCNFVH